MFDYTHNEKITHVNLAGTSSDFCGGGDSLTSGLRLWHIKFTRPQFAKFANRSCWAV